MRFAPLCLLALSSLLLSSGLAPGMANASTTDSDAEPSSGPTRTAATSESADQSLYLDYSTAAGPSSTTSPSQPKCTWDSVQIPDPVKLNPVASYAYDNSTNADVGPGRIDPDIIKLVRSLSLEEKVGQMTQIQVGQIVDCNGFLNETAVEYWIDKWKVGSFLESPGNHNGRYRWYSPQVFANFTDAVQRIAVKKGARIPVIWGLDSVRGANYVKGGTMFLAGAATAATFDPQFAYEAGRIAAKDTRAAGAHWAFAPILDLGVNKLWARNYENFGEDPYLSAQMGAASVRGFQGNYKKDRSRVAACMKHFIGYGNPFDGTDRANRHIAPHELLEYYVPPFKAAIDAGVSTAMEAYGAVNGETVMLSNYYLQELLRDKLGFRGMMVTDWGEIISQVSTYKTAKDAVQATSGALARTSVDMSMVADDESFSKITYELVKNGTISERRIDESVARVLQIKKDLGLFEDPFTDISLQETVGSAQDIKSARDAVRESITLLKNNNNVLPLKPTDKVLFLGPTLNSTRYMCGGWNVHWQGPSDKEGDSVYEGFGDTVLQGVKQVTGSDPQYFQGADIGGNNLIDINAVVAAAKNADKIVVGLGEPTYAENMGNIDNLALPWQQQNLVYTVADATKKPVVVVLIEGRARGLGWLPSTADAIVNAYLPGAYGGLPIAEVLYGKVNPSGRLPFSYPASESQASTTIWQSSYVAYKPQWQFGYGLGYSKLEYTNVTVSSNVLKVGSPITATVAITNKGPYAQKEPVLLFTHQQYRFGYAPDLFRLRSFKKITLAPGETKTVSFTVKAEDQAFWDRSLRKRIEPSLLDIAINPFTQQNILAVVDLQTDPNRVLERA